MRKFLIASAAILSFAGVAAAQEAPALIYSDAFATNVQNVDMNADGALSMTSQRNASVTMQDAGHSAYDIRANENYSGR